MPIGVYMRTRRPAADRFWAKVDKTGTCWLWTGALDKSGYGSFNATGSKPVRTMLAHRFSYMLTHGGIPDGFQVDHLCRVRACVRPEHLEAVSLAENMRRAAAAVTHCPQGHDYTDQNTYWYGRNRQCRPCHVVFTRNYRTRKALEETK